MATKKKAAQPAHKPKVMDPALVSNQPWEILHVRLIHYMKGPYLQIIHPSPAEVKILIKKHNNSRNCIYADLQKQGYTRIKKRGA